LTFNTDKEGDILKLYNDRTRRLTKGFFLSDMI